MSYDIIAPFYDTVMKHVDYTEWYDLIVRIIRKFRIASPVSLLEIGAGTGTLGSMINENDDLFDYYGSDLCFNMALQAHKKNVALFCADGCRLPVKKQFDLVIFLYDGINYLASIDDYGRLFDSVARSLKCGGLFLFDITTRENSFSNFFDIFDYQEIRGTSIIRHSYYQPKKNIQKNDFLFFSPVDSREHLFFRQFETHSQKVFNPEQIRCSIPDEVFSCQGIWDGFSMKPSISTSERIHFLLKKISDD